MKQMFTNSSLLCSTLLLVLCFFSNIQDAKSCIDPDTVITVTTNYNMNFSEIEIRLGNLKLMTEQPNVYCSCALTSFDEFFTHLEYVAFVLTGTNTVYPNMAPWENTTAADAAWEDAQPFLGDWNGFIAQVINGGLAPSDDVELVIRASTPPGLYVNVVELDSTLSLSYLGTDAWDPVNESLFADHQGLRNLGFDISSKTYNQVADEYFLNLDGDILSDVETPQNDLRFSVGPNPFHDVLHLNYDLRQSAEVSINIYNISGQLVLHRDAGFQNQGRQSTSIPVSDGLLSNEMYFIEIQSEFEKGTQKILRAF
ncbi:MAG: T9SS type A sorting domain-containing protein [Bacteroidota bacterium]